MPGPGSFSSHGREPTPLAPPGQTFQPLSLGPLGSYNHGQAPPFPSGASNLSHIESVRPGMMANLQPHAPEGLRSQQAPSNMMVAETYPHRPGYLNGSLGFGLQEKRFKSFPVPGQQTIDRAEFEGDLKKFPGSSLDAELNSKVGGYPLGPRGSGLDEFDYDGGSKFIIGTGANASRLLPIPNLPNEAGERTAGFHDNTVGKSGPVQYGSPVGEYTDMSSRRRGPLFGSLLSKSDIDDFDGIGLHRIGGSVGTPFGDSRFHHFPSHLHRGEFEGPANFRISEHPRTGDFIGEDGFVGHFQRDEHLGPRNLPRHFAHTGNMRTTELGGRHSFESFTRGNRTDHPRLGEPRCQSRFSHPGFLNDGGFLTGDIGSFDDLWKRKVASMGWCRICKVDSESVEGLDLHSQKRVHQKMAMDMVKIIKQNAKKQKLSPGKQSFVEDGSKSRNFGFEGCGIKH